MVVCIVHLVWGTLLYIVWIVDKHSLVFLCELLEFLFALQKLKLSKSFLNVVQKYVERCVCQVVNIEGHKKRSIILYEVGSVCTFPGVLVQPSVLFTRGCPDNYLRNSPAPLPSPASLTLSLSLGAHPLPGLSLWTTGQKHPQMKSQPAGAGRPLTCPGPTWPPHTAASLFAYSVFAISFCHHSQRRPTVRSLYDIFNLALPTQHLASQDVCLCRFLMDLIIRS